MEFGHWIDSEWVSFLLFCVFLQTWALYYMYVQNQLKANIEWKIESVGLYLSGT